MKCHELDCGREASSSLSEELGVNLHGSIHLCKEHYEKRIKEHNEKKEFGEN